MSRTQGIVQGDLAQPDGQIFLFPKQVILASEASTIHKIAAGEYSQRTSSTSDAYTFVGILEDILRVGMQDDLQEAFGSSDAGGAQGLPVGVTQTLATGNITAGSAVSVTVKSTVGFQAGNWVLVDTVASTVQEACQIQSITSATVMVLKTVVNSHTAVFPIAQNLFTTPAGVTGRPPYTGMSQLTPVTAPRPKGIRVKGVTVNYAVNTTAITVPTVGLYATSYSYGAAPVVTTLITNATNGLLVGAASEPYSIPVPVPIANRGFTVTPNSVISVEFDFTTGGSGSVDVLGFVLSCDFNYT